MTAPLVDYHRMGRRMRTAAAILFSVAVVAWLVSLPLAGVSLRRLFAFGGFALFGMFAVEVVVVGGGALRGMLRAGERGDRLARDDVGILPPQLGRRRR